MWRNMKLKMTLAATVMGLAGCLGNATGGSTGAGGAVGGGGNETAAEASAASTLASQEQATSADGQTYDHPTDQDPFAILARIQQEGSPAVSTLMHGCGAPSYAQVGTVLKALGVNITNTTKNSAGAIYTAGAQALGQANYAARVPNALDLTTSGATKLFDIVTQAASELIASAGTATCTLAGQPQAIFASDGSCNKAGLSCLQGYPATQAQVDLCNNIRTSASSATVGQQLAVATLLSAALTCN